jgi:predicted nucleic acid-binding protein
MSVLVDTNVLLRRTQPGHESHGVAVASVARLLASGEELYFTLQNIAEFWSVVTRPVGSNGLGFSPKTAAAEVEKIERALIVLGDTPALYGQWKRLMVQHGVVGTKVHDTRLVAAMMVHCVPKILTFNTADFVRYPIEVLKPADIAAG